MGKNIKNYIKAKIKIVLKLVPLQNIIIFESHDDFCDNSRAIFDYIVSQGLNRTYRMIWLVEQPFLFRGQSAENVKFIRAEQGTVLEKAVFWYYIAAARYAFFTHRTPPFKLNRGELFINLWHGCGLKNVSICNLGLNFDYVIYSSDFYKRPYTELLKCRPEQLLPLGNPRTDLLFARLDVLSRLGCSDYGKIIIWMPTYRVHKNGYKSFKSVTETQFIVPVITSKLEFDEINKILIKNNILLIIKMHPAQDLKGAAAGSFLNIRFLTNRMLEDKGVQLYSLLGATDALITDYSSVYVDYLLTGKPIGFTIDDMEDLNTGYLFEKPLELMPGKHMTCFEDIKGFILDIAASKDEFEARRQETNRILNKYTDGQISKRIVDYFGIK